MCATLNAMRAKGQPEPRKIHRAITMIVPIAHRSIAIAQ
jgi:hypothetical protein